MLEKIIIEKEIAGKILRLETGNLAKQANGSVLVSYADTMVLVTATCSDNPREGIDFFPLTVNYEEKLYAAGKIPGGFIKREGRPTEKSTLTCRLIDRPIRPLFPEGLRNEVQIIALVLSADQQNDSDIPAIIGASAALSISDIPFCGPIGAVRIGLVNNKFILNPTYQELKESHLNLVVAGKQDDIMMVEAGAHEIEETEILEALKLGQTIIKEIVELINELVAKAGKPKTNYPLDKPDADLENIIRHHFTKNIREAMRITDKTKRNKALKEISKDAAISILKESMGEHRDRLISILTEERSFDFEVIVKKIQEEELRKMILEDNLRPDGRKNDEIREISSSINFLPRAHGSGLFTRGQTQVLTILTLGTASDEQILDGLREEESKHYMHHYNFSPFSTGETKPMRGPGRREIGHGALAEKALFPMLPKKEDFPYTIRLVSEVLESNGSTSMASVCASALALMDGGVPIKNPVSGIAMGLIMQDNKYAVLSDIQGMEDALGEMDFKVAGTEKGITALQMDIKMQGINFEILELSLNQAKIGRFFILNKMKECIDKPKKELSLYAPTIFTMLINPDKIKDVIGPGGKIINKIIAETGVKIDIESDGKIFIASVNKEGGIKAKKIIENLTREVEVGEIYLGKVMRIVNFGAFVEILPGKDGLVHISQLALERVEKVEDVVKIGEEIMVKVTEIDSQGRINLTRKGLIETPAHSRNEQKDSYRKEKFYR